MTRCKAVRNMGWTIRTLAQPVINLVPPKKEDLNHERKLINILARR